MGYQKSNPLPLGQLISPYQQQPNIIDFMANMVFDGYNFLNLSSPVVAPENINIQMIVLTDRPASLAQMLPAPSGVLSSFPGAVQDPRFTNGPGQSIPTGGRTAK